MPNFYNPNDIDPEDPVLCRCAPIKWLVSLIQLAAIILSFGAIALNHETTFAVLGQIFLLAFLIVSFAGFWIEHEKIMFVHSFVMTIGSVIPLGVLLCLTIGYIGHLTGVAFLKLFDLTKNGNDVDLMTLFFVLLFVLFYLFYTWMCRKLTVAASVKRSVMPDFDTTQGLFQARDDYDVHDRLLYPKL